MGTYDVTQFMDLFGGLPDRGEAVVDPREVADLRRDERDEYEDFTARDGETVTFRLVEPDGRVVCAEDRFAARRALANGPRGAA